LGNLPSKKQDASSPSLEAEVRRLKRENALLLEEREILKKAAVFFAKETR
jgi:transposase